MLTIQHKYAKLYNICKVFNSMQSITKICKKYATLEQVFQIVQIVLGFFQTSLNTVLQIFEYAVYSYNIVEYLIW